MLELVTKLSISVTMKYLIVSYEPQINRLKVV